jgi:hypothetical protein
VLEPIFEADLQPEQYAYRPDRSALDAVRAVHKLLNTGHQQVVDADLSSYFDTIPHAELLKSVARRVADGAMLHLIKMWLEEKSDFLGYTFGRCYSPQTGRAYLGTTPAKRRVQRICETISEATRRSQTQQAVDILVAKLNREILGWANYFCLGPVSQAYRAVERHARRRLRQWLKSSVNNASMAAAS